MRPIGCYVLVLTAFMWIVGVAASSPLMIVIAIGMTVCVLIAGVLN